MKRHLLVAGLVIGLIGACGCGSSKPEVPSWFKSSSGGKDKDKPGKPTADAGLTDLKTKMAKLQKKIDALDGVIKDVDKRKIEIVESLRKEGVTSSADLKKAEFKDNEVVTRLVKKLVDNGNQRAKYEQMRKEFRSLHEDGKDALTQLEQQQKLRDAGLNDKELDDLNIAIKKIEEKLDAKDPSDPVKEINSDTILDRELKKGGF
jgi:hypothetical protein